MKITKYRQMFIENGIIRWEQFIVNEDNNIKRFRSKDYNYIFDKHDGNFARWGTNHSDDPVYSPFGNEILDIEVTDICKGPGGKLCPFCYKSNGPVGKNMSFDTFKMIIDKMPPTITQIAFGADAQAESNPDLFRMAHYARSKGIIPNITVADISMSTAEELAAVMGAVAVSRYADKNICYDTIEKLSAYRMRQINIHIMLSKETLPWVMETLEDYKTDRRLRKMRAIVFLSLKKKGRGVSHNTLTNEEFKSVVDKALDSNISFGFDSCSCNKFLKAIKDRDNYEDMTMMAEPCESTMFSAYINTEGKFFPCSFCENHDEWTEGIDMRDVNDFVKDVWNNERVIKFRQNLTRCCRSCPVFEV